MSQQKLSGQQKNGSTRSNSRPPSSIIFVISGTSPCKQWHDQQQMILAAPPSPLPMPPPPPAAHHMQSLSLGRAVDAQGHDEHAARLSHASGDVALIRITGCWQAADIHCGWGPFAERRERTEAEGLGRGAGGRCRG